MQCHMSRPHVLEFFLVLHFDNSDPLVGGVAKVIRQNQGYNISVRMEADIVSLFQISDT